MFETTHDVLVQLGNFAIIGFFLGLLYDFFRFVRIVVPHSHLLVNIEDFLFLVFSGFVLFCVSLEIGQGGFRLYYAVSALFGAAVFRFTLGFLTTFTARLIKQILFIFLKFMNKILITPVKRIFKAICQKFKTIFGAKCRKNENLVKKVILHLKNRHGIVYNNSIIMDKVGGEERSVIKAKVRKKA